MRHNLNRNNQDIIDYAMSHNINYFETCYFYLDNQCEDYVYSLLSKYPRESYEICGKMSLNDAFNEQMGFQKMFELQLKKVPKHYFDVYLLQTLRPAAYSQIFYSDLISFLLREKEKGNIVRFGFSEQCDSGLLSKFLSLNCWDIAQMALNYYDWYFCQKDQNYNLITSHNIPIIAQAPFKGGHIIKDLTPAMKNIITTNGRTPAELAMDFVNDKKPEIILAGVSQLKTLQEYEQAHNNYRPIEDIEPLLKLLDLYKKQIFIPCILCTKCRQVCPKHIDLPLYISLHNQTLKNAELFPALSTLKYFHEEPYNQCTRCGNCKLICPIGTDPSSRLIDIFNLRP